MQLAKFGKIGLTAQQVNNGLVRLFTNRTDDSSMMYRIVRRSRVCSLVTPVTVC